MDIFVVIYHTEKGVVARATRAPSASDAIGQMAIWLVEEGLSEAHILACFAEGDVQNMTAVIDEFKKEFQDV